MKTTNRNCKKKCCGQCQHLRLVDIDGYCEELKVIRPVNSQACKKLIIKK